MLNTEAGVIDDLIVYFFTPEHYRIVVNAGTAEKDIAWMQAQLKGFSAELAKRRGGSHAVAMLAVQGPKARERFWAAFPDSRAASEPLGIFQGVEFASTGGDWLIARTGYTGEDGFEITLPADDAAADLEKTGGRRHPPLRPRRARHAAPRSRHESLRPGHGRKHLAL